MKTNIIKWSTLILAMVIAFSSCKKDSDTAEIISTTPTEYLTAGSWKITAMTIDPGVDIGNGILLTDVFSLLDACEKDDLMVFNTNGTITADEGVLKCNPDSPQTSNDGSWSLSSDNKTLTIIPAADNSEDPTIQATVITLNNAELVMSFESEGFAGDKNESAAYKYSITMKK